MSRIFGQKNRSCRCVAFLPPGKSGESSEIEQFDNYNLFVTTQFGKEGSRRIVCHSPGRRPQVQQSTFFLLLLLAAKRRHVLIIMRDTELLENRNMVCKISCSFTHKVSLPFINHVPVHFCQQQDIANVAINLFPLQLVVETFCLSVQRQC